jgi:rod shape-determining protein MreC
MMRVTAFLRSFREYLALAALSALSIVLIVHNDSAPVAMLRSTTLAVVASLRSAPSRIAGRLAPSGSEQQLQEINLGLLEEIMQLRRLRRENEELRALLSFRSQQPWSLQPAEIVGKQFALGLQTLTLNTGSDDSISVRMPVISERGLVGNVLATSTHYAIVQILLNRDVRVTAKINRSRIDGIIAWSEGDMLQFQNVWKTADVLVGDTVVTSEYSNTYPPDIPIGIVTSLGPDKRGQYSRIDVRPNVRFASLERVFVLRARGNPERAALEQQHASPAGTMP